MAQTFVIRCHWADEIFAHRNAAADSSRRQVTGGSRHQKVSYSKTREPCESYFAGSLQAWSTSATGMMSCWPSRKRLWTWVADGCWCSLGNLWQLHSAEPQTVQPKRCFCFCFPRFPPFNSNFSTNIHVTPCQCNTYWCTRIKAEWPAWHPIICLGFENSSREIAAPPVEARKNPVAKPLRTLWDIGTWVPTPDLPQPSDIVTMSTHDMRKLKAAAQTCKCHHLGMCSTLQVQVTVQIHDTLTGTGKTLTNSFLIESPHLSHWQCEMGHYKIHPWLGVLLRNGCQLHINFPSLSSWSWSSRKGAVWRLSPPWSWWKRKTPRYPRITY